MLAELEDLARQAAELKRLSRSQGLTSAADLETWHECLEAHHTLRRRCVHAVGFEDGGNLADELLHAALEGCEPGVEVSNDTSTPQVQRLLW